LLKITLIDILTMLALLAVVAWGIHTMSDRPFQEIGNDFYVYQYHGYTQENVTLHDGEEQTLTIATVSEIENNTTRNIIVSNTNMQNFSNGQMIVYNQFKTDINIDVMGYMYPIKNEVK